MYVIVFSISIEATSTEGRKVSIILVILLCLTTNLLKSNSKRAEIYGLSITEVKEAFERNLLQTFRIVFTKTSLKNPFY